jgi:hypothetical protein
LDSTELEPPDIQDPKDMCELAFMSFGLVERLESEAIELGRLLSENHVMNDIAFGNLAGCHFLSFFVRYAVRWVGIFILWECWLCFYRLVGRDV